MDEYSKIGWITVFWHSEQTVKNMQVYVNTADGASSRIGHHFTQKLALHNSYLGTVELQLKNVLESILDCGAWSDTLYVQNATHRTPGSFVALEGTVLNWNKIYFSEADASKVLIMWRVTAVLKLKTAASTIASKTNDQWVAERHIANARKNHREFWQPLYRKSGSH